MKEYKNKKVDKEMYNLINNIFSGKRITKDEVKRIKDLKKNKKN